MIGLVRVFEKTKWFEGEVVISNGKSRHPHRPGPMTLEFPAPVAKVTLYDDLVNGRIRTNGKSAMVPIRFPGIASKSHRKNHQDPESRLSFSDQS